MTKIIMCLSAIIAALVFWGGMNAAWAVCGKACICGAWNNYCRGGEATVTVPSTSPPGISRPSTPPSIPTPTDPVLIVRKTELGADSAQLAAVLEKPDTATVAVKPAAGTAMIQRIEGNWDDGYRIDEVIATALLPVTSEGRGMQTAGATAWQQLQDAVGIAALAYAGGLNIAKNNEDAAFLADQIARASMGEEVRVELRRGGVSPFSISTDALSEIAAVSASFGVKFDELREIQIRKAELQEVRRKNVALLSGQGNPPRCDGIGNCQDAAARDEWRKTVAKVDSEIAALDVREMETVDAKNAAVDKLTAIVPEKVKIKLHSAKE